MVVGTGRAIRGAAGPGPGFEHDIYTVVLATDPRWIPVALDQVPPHRRPRPHGELLDFYAHTYPGYPVALCFFDNADARKAAPLLLWYPPRDPNWLVAPAIDCHTGRPPSPKGRVRVDHHLIVGVPTRPTRHGPGPQQGFVYYRQPVGALAAFLPTCVAGRQFTRGRLPNGDFAVPAVDVRAGRLDRVCRRPRTAGSVRCRPSPARRRERPTLDTRRRT